MTLVAVVMIDKGSAMLGSHVRDSAVGTTQKGANPAFGIEGDSEAMVNRT